MRTAIAVLAAFAGLGIGAAAVAADDMPPLKVMGGMPNMGKGQWKVDLLEGGGKPTSASICLESLTEMARGGGTKGKPGAQAQAGCTNRVIENAATRGVIESTCPQSSVRTTITRDGPKSLLLQTQGKSQDRPVAMKARYTYEGACKAGGAAVTLDKNSPQCQQMRSMPGMDPAQMCASAGANRAMCEEQVRQSVAQMKAMCQ